MKALKAIEKPRSAPPLNHEQNDNPQPPAGVTAPKPPPNEATSNERWVYTGTEEVSQALAKVATELTTLRHAIKQSNEIGSENSPLSPIHRAMLLAMLQAMLIELTQPYVEQGRIKGFFKGVTDLLKKGAKDAVSKEVADALGAAADAGKDLVTSIMTSPGIDNLTDLPPGSWSA